MSFFEIDKTKFSVKSRYYLPISNKPPKHFSRSWLMQKWGDTGTSQHLLESTWELEHLRRIIIKMPTVIRQGVRRGHLVGRRQQITKPCSEQHVRSYDGQLRTLVSNYLFSLRFLNTENAQGATKKISGYCAEKGHFIGEMTSDYDTWRNHVWDNTCAFKA